MVLLEKFENFLRTSSSPFRYSPFSHGYKSCKRKEVKGLRVGVLLEDWR